MIEITELGLQKLMAFQQEENTSLPIRIALMSGASASPNLGIIPEEAKENDEIYDFNGFKVIIDKNLMAYCEKIVIDWVKTELTGCLVEGGFKITAKNRI
ncbi:MAG: hypothetical protein CSB24_01820 [Deltaproteobacteria bacterium]|nr:MAG: hypothetical protein CSB24_01820 [Deltaproteobacteria bacterium]